MGLNIDLVSQFAKLTANKKETKKESTAWGEVVEITESGKCFVKLDGSDRVTPVDTMSEVKAGDRVSVTIKNHSATLTGSTSSPAASVNTTGSLRTDFKNLSADNLLIREKLTASEGYISELTAKNLKVEETLEAHEGKFENLEADVAEFERLSATYATIDSLNAKDAEIRNLLADYATVENLTATNAKITSLEAEDAEIRKLFSDYATITHLESTYATIGALDAAIADIDALNVDVAGIHTALVDYATIKDLKAGYATIASLNALDAKVGNLDADVGDINTLIFGSASGDVIQTSFANAVIAQLGDAQIKSAMIQDISADKITSGDIITNNVKVKSEDGLLLIADQTIQISDGTRARVQIGKDAANDYSINIWDSNGKLMFSEGGLTENAVKEAIIRNDMVKDDANISASKLDIDTLFNVINEDGSHTLKSSKVKLDEENQTLDVAFKSMTAKIDGIEVGGCNLLSNTRNYTGISGASDFVRVDGEVETYRDLNIRYLDCTSLEVSITSYKDFTQWIKSITAEGGAQYVLSFYAKGTKIRSHLYSGAFAVARCESSQGIIKTNAGDGAMDFTLTDEWQRYWVVYTMEDTNTQSSTDPKNVLLRVMGGQEAYVCGVKFERGNKATDWSPAPDDAEVQISSLTTKYASLNSTIDSLESTIATQSQEIEKKADGSTVTELSTKYSNLSQTVDGLSSTVSKHMTEINKKADSSTVTTVNNRVTTLESNLDGFKSTVSDTYTTKTEFNNLAIGGRNLIAGTSLDTIYSGVKVAEATPKDVWAAKTIGIPTETEYVVSFDAKADSDTSIQCFFYMPNTTLTSESNTGDSRTNTTDGVSYVNITTEWKRYWVKWTQDGSATDTVKSVIVGRNFSETNRVYIRAVKLEAGNKPTAWSPAPEDTKKDITALTTRMTSAETSINQNRDSIALCATKVEVEETFGGYYTKTETDSQIKVAADKIDLKVSSVELELSGRSEGRNLLLNTGNANPTRFTNGASCIRSGCSTAVRYYDDGSQVEYYNTTGAEVYLRFMVPDTGNLYGMVPGCAYTFIGQAKVITTSGTLEKLTVRSQDYVGSWGGGVTTDILTEDSSAWVEFTSTFTLRKNATGCYISVQLYFNGSWNGQIWLRKLKIEKGDKATAWSLAPEDVTDISSRLTTAESGISVLNNDIKLYATKTELTESLSGYYTKTETDARIELTSESITQTVEAYQMTGRNLIANTSQDEIELGGYPESGYSKGATGKTISVPTGDEYTLSFDAKSTVNGDRIRCYFYSPNTTLTVITSTNPGVSSNNSDGVAVMPLTTEWKRYWIKYTQNGAETTSTKSWIVGRRMAGEGSGNISVRAIKLEAGSQPTSWTAAPDDNVTYVTSQIKQLADSISLEVTGSLGDTASIQLSANGKTTTQAIDMSDVRTAFANDTTAVTISAGTVTFNSDTFIVNSTYFKVTADGTITASAGRIGELYMSNGKLFNTANATNSWISGLNAHYEVAIDSTIFIWAGARGGTNVSQSDTQETFGKFEWADAKNIIESTASFYVTHKGELHATQAEIEGTITTTSDTAQAKLTSGSLALYRDDTIYGAISSKYHPGSVANGLTLTVRRSRSSGLMFAAAAGDDLFGSSYEIYYQMQPAYDALQYCYDMQNACQHTFHNNVRFTGLTQHMSPSFFMQAIYLNNQASIGWLTSNGSPYQFLTVSSSNEFEVGMYSSYTTTVQGKTVNIAGYSDLYLKNYKETLRVQGLTTIGTYSGYFYSLNNGLCCLGTSYYRWYRLYAKYDCNISSDRRLKENIVPMSDAHSALFDKLQPTQYNFIEGNGRVHYGLIAQDVISAMGELGIEENELDLVSHDCDVNPETGELNDTYSMSYQNLIPMLIHEVQKLKQELKTLKGE